LRFQTVALRGLLRNAAVRNTSRLFLHLPPTP
jgi:hypothetical protein